MQEAQITVTAMAVVVVEVGGDRDGVKACNTLPWHVRTHR
jgi:hypothetical protein